MRRSVQRWIAIGSLVAAVGVAAIAAPSAVLTPVIDRPGVTRYCDVVTAAFASASASIDLLLSSADVANVPLWSPLVAAAERGVDVRVLLDASDWAPEITVDNQRVVTYLSEHGIACRLDDPEVTVHAKLVVVDRAVVVLGSTNWNRYAFAEHEQANVAIENDQVGAAFATYFDRLWDGRLAEDGVGFDLAATRSDGPTLVPLPDGPGTSLYATLLLDLLARARRSVHVAMYRLSVYPNYPDSVANELVKGLVAAAGRGLDVRVLIDDCRTYASSAEANLASAIHLYQHGIEVRFDRPERTTHTKLVVLDGESVVLGSTNWNYYALERNVEASVGLLRIPAIAEPFDAYFEALWADGRPIVP